jgi:DNA-binding transcriptional ArsR family regulator
MGISKTENFGTDLNELAAITKALGHPARLAILNHLMRTNSCVCGDIVDVLPLAQATVSQHLKALKEVGLIQGEISGTSVCYCIHAENWQKYTQWVTAYFNQFDPVSGKCC